MYSTPLPEALAALPTLSVDDRAQLLTDPALSELAAVFAAVPDPRQPQGRRYPLPFLLTCLVAALLCTCNSTWRWKRGAGNSAGCWGRYLRRCGT